MSKSPRIKVATILGTRPEMIRLSRLIPLFDTVFDHTYIHTGQNYDPTLADDIAVDLDLRAPDVQLQTKADSLGASLALLFPAIEKTLNERKPEAVVILGDTNSGLAALLAARMGIKIYHMEAGNRAFDRSIPEETNRRAIDAVSHFNLVYTAACRENLMREGMHPQRVHITGSPVMEVLSHYKGKIDASDVLTRLGLHHGQYILASLHRQETVDDPVQLKACLDGLEALAAETKLPVLFSTHPRVKDKVSSGSAIRFVPAVVFTDFVHLQQNAALVVSDSGTIGEEAAVLRFRAISPRRSMERPDALDCGSVLLCGTGTNSIVRAGLAQLALPLPAHIPADYAVTDTSARVAKLIAGTVHADVLKHAF